MECTEYHSSKLDMVRSKESEYHLSKLDMVQSNESEYHSSKLDMVQSKELLRRSTSGVGLPVVVCSPEAVVGDFGVVKSKASSSTRSVPFQAGLSCVVPSPVETVATISDKFIIRIPGGKKEHLIPGSCVRSVDLTATEVIECYANSLNLSGDDLVLSKEDLSEVFESILKQFSVATFKDRARLDAADFVFPDEVMSFDTAAYKKTGSCLKTLVFQMQADRASDRFNVDRCDAMFKDDPEYDILRSLAVDGVIIDRPEEFIIQNVPEPPRKMEVELRLTYQKHAFKVWQKKYGILLRQDEISLQDREKIHYNPAHLTDKPPGSRFLMDCANSESGNVLNTPDVKEKVLERYNVIQHCTIKSIVTDWYAYAAKENVKLDQCRIFKDDFSGAFAQMNVNPESSYLLAIAIGCGLVLIYLVGLFGWLGFPMAFAVFSRAFERKFRRELNIPLVLYVDDIIALSLAERAASDQRHIELECEKAMGSKAISYEKQVRPCLSCDVLGWLTDLSSETFRPCEKGTRKLIFAFWLVASGNKFPLSVYSLLAGLAEHYSLGLPGMAPFVYPLHAMVAKFQGNEYWKKEPSSAARLSIEIWRVVALLSLQKHPLMCRSLRCLLDCSRVSELLTWVYTDASPTGLGMGLYDHNQNLIAYMAYQFPFNAQGPEFQCAREYFGFMFGFIFIEWVLGKSVCTRVAAWVNDNKAAITWAENSKCNSMAAQYAYMAVTWQQLFSKFRFIEVEHQKGVLMGDIDGLSRGFPHSLDINKKYVLNSAQCTSLDKLFSVLDPSVQNNLISHHEAFVAVVNLTRELSKCV